MMDERALKRLVEDAVDTALAHWIVQEVIRRWQERPRDCVLYFHGSQTGFEKSCDSLARLTTQKNIQLSAVLSPGAERLLGREKVVRTIDSEAVCSAEDGCAEERLMCADVIVLPSLTLSSAAKLAVGIRDDVSSRLISDALICGKPIIAAIDGVIPTGERTPPAYRNMAERHLSALAEYGVILSSAAQIGEAAEKLLCTAEPAPQSVAVELQQRIVTLAELNSLPVGGRVLLRADAIISPAAKDAAREKNIKLERKAGGGL